MWEVCSSNRRGLYNPHVKATNQARLTEVSIFVVRKYHQPNFRRDSIVAFSSRKHEKIYFCIANIHKFMFGLHNNTGKLQKRFCGPEFRMSCRTTQFHLYSSFIVVTVCSGNACARIFLFSPLTCFLSVAVRVCSNFRYVRIQCDVSPVSMYSVTAHFDSTVTNRMRINMQAPPYRMYR